MTWVTKDGDFSGWSLESFPVLRVHYNLSQVDSGLCKPVGGLGMRVILVVCPNELACFCEMIEFLEKYPEAEGSLGVGGNPNMRDVIFRGEKIMFRSVQWDFERGLLGYHLSRVENFDLIENPRVRDYINMRMKLDNIP